MSLLIAACSGSQNVAAPDDATLRRNARAAGLAVSLNRPEEAIVQYQRALEQARARDDVGALGDYGYDLAVAELAANRPEDALKSVRMTRAELARRGAASFFALDLAEAAALYRLGDKQASDALAARVESGGDAGSAARASFLRGLIADETDNVTGLNDALMRLAHPVSDDERADADELEARWDMRNAAFKSASDAALRAADLRRANLNYRGMARALSVAAVAEARAGNTQAAASLYMRAGQSAAAQGDAISARLWLNRALELESDPGLRQEVESVLVLLNKH